MEKGIVVIFFIFFSFMGGLMGHSIGTYREKMAILECEKDLPRNVNCKIIAVPVDKN